MIKFQALVASLLIHGLVFGFFTLNQNATINPALTLGGELKRGNALQEVHLQLYEELQQETEHDSEIEDEAKFTQKVPDKTSPIEEFEDGNLALSQPQPKPQEKAKPKPQAEPPKTDQKPPSEKPLKKVASKKPIKPQKVNDTPKDLKLAEANINKRSSGDGLQANRGISGDTLAHATLWQSYKRDIFDAINTQQDYPRQAKLRRIEGIVVMRFTLEANGKVENYEIAQKAEARLLNRSALKLFKRLNLPSPPAGLENKFPAELSIPLKYAFN